MVATPTARFAGSVGLCNRQKTHGSQKALTVATNAIFIGGSELEKGHGAPLLKIGIVVVLDLVKDSSEYDNEKEDECDPLDLAPMIAQSVVPPFPSYAVPLERA